MFASQFQNEKLLKGPLKLSFNKKTKPKKKKQT